MADVPRAGKRHNLIRQPPRCTSFSGGVCSVQGESEMRGGCSFVFRRRHQSEKQLYLQPAPDLTLRHDRSLQEGGRTMKKIRLLTEARSETESVDRAVNSRR